MAERNDRFNWDDDDNYWRSNYRTRPYASSSSFDYDGPSSRALAVASPLVLV